MRAGNLEYLDVWDEKTQLVKRLRGADALRYHRDLNRVHGMGRQLVLFVGVQGGWLLGAALPLPLYVWLACTVGTLGALYHAGRRAARRLEKSVAAALPAPRR